jgi:hypothetical protein
MTSQQQSPHLVPGSQHQVNVQGVGAAANGSTDTAVLRFTAANITNTQGGVTFTETAAAGTILTVVKPGIWIVSLFAALAAAGNLQIGIGLNAAAAGNITTSPTDFAVVDAGAGAMGVIALAGDTSAAAEDGPHLLSCQRTLALSQGDTLRFYATAAVTTDAANTRFFMTQVAS